MPQWTPEQARAYSAKAAAASVAARKLRALNRAQAARLTTAPAGYPTDQPFADLLLARTRAHVANLNQVLATELTKAKPDPAAIDRLASAWERLAEVERRLAGRPLPGSRKPAPETASPRPAPRPALAPIMPTTDGPQLGTDDDPTAGNYG